ncbi:amino acid/polyamine/organocation transporter, APC superfamily [Halomicrobium zhouii]|uniref:Amino acid/polyamine/organocation transporter, APC superfamily n=1 Tax=Halomicrobium zhouii TaxID=767519 RepID=A0A1I6KRZ1_9EURY|nr:amino acid permease [Halomicrobium zhouii]SFR93999.1 amino acid/polyamine/organocation transporter, APC superfamily [Halomicrobium zhouii]
MSDTELAKDLGLVSAMTIGIGTMIGAGIFVLPGVAAQEAGPIVVASFVIGGLIAMVNALSVSELGTAMPRAGGGYYYVNRALGPVFGSIAGMGDWMGLAFASAFYCIGFGQYLTTLVPIPGVPFLNEIQIGALLAGMAFVGVNYVGAKETGGIQTVIVTLLLGILTAFAVAGWFSFDYATLAGSDGLAPFGTGAILPGTALVFVSFLGYAKIATVAEELKDPGRNLPIAIIGSVAIVTVLYAILVTLMLGVVSWPELSQDAPVAQAAQLAFPASIGPVGGVAAAAATIMTLGALLATASSANASILASARINFAMGRDKIVTNWLNEIHPNYATPYRSILVTGAVIVVFIALLGRDIEILAKAASVLHLIVYALMNVALIVFREADPEYDPEFTVPFYPVTPIAGALLSLGLVAFMDEIEIALSGVFVVVALGWYAVYARTRTPQEGVLSSYLRDEETNVPGPVVDAADAVAPNGGEGPTIMVALSNPRTEGALVTLAGALAAAQGGRVVATHVITVPDQTPLDAASEQPVEAESERLLADAKRDAESFDVPIETRSILSHRGLHEVFDAATESGADTLVMGYGGNHLAAGRAEGTLDELAHDLPCDVLVLDGETFDPERVLIPTAGGISSDLSAAVGAALRETTGAAVTLLHVADDETEGRAFLTEWAGEHDLGDAALRVESGDVETAIERAAKDHTLMVVGATERGLLSRLVRDSLLVDVIDDVETSVLLAERPRTRSLRERLFGRR